MKALLTAALALPFFAASDGSTPDASDIPIHKKPTGDIIQVGDVYAVCVVESRVGSRVVFSHLAKVAGNGTIQVRTANIGYMPVWGSRVSGRSLAEVNAELRRLGVTLKKVRRHRNANAR